VRDLLTKQDSWKNDGSVDLASSNESSSHYHVQNKEIVDPYGESGYFSGTLSTKTDMPDGYGSMRYTDPEIRRTYEGTWENGRWHGRGKLEHGNGDVYEGDFVQDNRHGRGTYHHSAGRRYIGEFFNNKRHGQGILSCDEFQYHGEFKNGNQSGQGRMHFAKGGHYEGEFHRNLFWGVGERAWADGRFYQGHFVKGRRHGTGIEFHGDGSLRYQGTWYEDQPVGG